MSPLSSMMLKSTASWSRYSLSVTSGSSISSSTSNDEEEEEERELAEKVLPINLRSSSLKMDDGGCVVAVAGVGSAGGGGVVVAGGSGLCISHVCPSGEAP